MNIRILLLLPLLVLPRNAFALCAGPTGNEGDVQYSGVQHMMAYCNGANWISMGANAAIAFSGLTSGDFCTATSSTSIVCSTGSTGTGSVVLAASPSMTSPTVSSGGLTVTAGGITVSAGGANITGTVTGTTFSGSGASLTSIGTSNMSAITGTASSTTFLTGNGTWSAVTPTFSGLTSGDFCTASSSTAVVCSTASTGTGSVVLSASPTLTGTVAGASSTWTGNVGIGTATPTTNVSVYNANQSATLTNFTQALTNAGLNVMSGYTAGDYTPGIFWSTANNNPTLPKAGIWTQTSSSGSYLNFGTSNAYGTGITNQAMVIDYSGNVGIGTTTPGQALDVVGVIRATSSIIGPQGSANTAAITFNGDNGTGLFDISASSTLGFTAEGHEGMRLLVTGNVGIGTTAPGALFTVGNNAFEVNSSGNIVTTGSLTAGGIAYPTTNGTSGYFLQTNGSGTASWAAVTPTFSGLTSGDFCTASSTSAIVCSTGSTGTGSVVLSASPTLTGTVTGAASNWSGNVGVGLTSPVVAFQAGNTTNAAGIEPRSDGVNIDGVGAANYARIGGFYQTNSIPGAAIGLAAQGASGQQGAITFMTKIANDNTTQPSVKMVIDESGNVGIGTTNPASKLHVASANTTTQAVIAVSDSAAAAGNFAYLWSGWSGGTPNSPAMVWGLSNDLRFGTGTTDFAGTGFSEKMRITSSGNVGIGTTSPGLPLHVYGSDTAINVETTGGSFAYLQLTTPSSGNGYLIKNIATANGALDKSLYLYNSNGPIQFFANGAVAQTINTAGNVGIGNTSPATFMDIKGNNVSYIGQLRLAATDYDQITFYNSGALTANAANRLGYIFYDVANTTLNIDSEGTNKYLVLNPGGGNVGIGNASPSATLDVVTTNACCGNNGIGLTGNVADVGLGIKNTTAGGQDWRILSSGTGSGVGAGNFNIYDQSGGGTRFSITSGGNVGIGATSPAAKLDVVTGGGGHLYTSDYGCGAYGGIGGNSALTGCTNYALLTSGGDTYINRPTGANIQFREANATQMTILTGGNVGIGVASPDSNLEVSSGGATNVSINGTSANATLKFENSGTMEWQMFNDTANGNSIRITNGTNGAKLNQGDTLWSSVSDARLKTNVQSLPVLDRLGNFRAVTFHWKGAGMPAAPQLGVIAQELYPLFPEVVTKGSDNPNEAVTPLSPGAWTVKYELLGALALEGVKELKAAFDGDHDAIAKLKADNDNLRRRDDELERQITELRREVHAQ
jgi:endosialidase-like protein